MVFSEGASDEEIKKAHRKLIIENHPDKFGQDAEARAKAEEKTKLINEARDVLLNRSWDPEYASAGTADGAPFSHDPFRCRLWTKSFRRLRCTPRSDTLTTSSHNSGTNSQGGTYSGNPFAGWPFGETFVWTTWDSTGQQHTYTSNTRIGKDPMAHKVRTKHTQAALHKLTPLQDLTLTLIRLVAPIPHAEPMTPLAASSICSLPKKKTLEEQLKDAKKDLALDLKLVGVKLVLLVLAFLLTVPATGLFLYTIISIGQGVWKRLRYLSLIFLVPFAMLALIFAPAGTAHIGIIPSVVFGCAVVFDVQNVYRHAKRISQIKNAMKK